MIHKASLQDNAAYPMVFEKAVKKLERLSLIWADGIYTLSLIDWVKQRCGWTLEIVRRQKS